MAHSDHQPGETPSSSISADTGQALKFLELLFSGKPNPYYFCLFTLPNQKTRFFTEIHQAAAHAAAAALDQDVYVQPAVFSSPQSRIDKNGNLYHVRGTKNAIDGICAIYADIDVASESHKKQDLPPDTDEAVQLVTETVLRPSLFVHSGHGLHAWWIFKEPFLFENPNDRSIVEEYCWSLQAVIKHAASRKGWCLDSTHDITRVLRLPGTINHKNPKNPRPVFILDDSGPLYSGPQDFEDYRIQAKALHSRITQGVCVPEEEKRRVSEDIVVNFQAELPPQFQAMCSNPKFRATWTGSRPDIAKASPSEYVMSLAVFGVQWGLTNQEIADLIVCWYRLHLNTPQFVNRDKPISLDKLKRENYLAMTIAKARKFHERKTVLDELDENKDLGSEDILTTIDKDKAEKIIKSVLGFEVRKIIKYASTEAKPIYVMYTEHGEIRFNGPEDMTSLSRFSNCVFAAIDNPVDVKISSSQWRVLKTLFRHLMFTHHVDETEITIEQRVQNMLEQYIQDKKPKTIKDISSDQEPFVHNGCWHVFESRLSQFLFNVLGVTSSRHELKTMLVQAGCAKKKYWTTLDSGKRKKIVCWAIPTRLVQPPHLLVIDGGLADDHDETNHSISMDVNLNQETTPWTPDSISTPPSS